MKDLPNRRILWGSSLMTLAMLGATAAQAQTSPAALPQSAAEPAAAPQDDSADSGNDIVVVGVRRALNDAAETKRNASTILDSISATDIGAFPDTSVAGALSRVPGITVARLQSADDSTHPSGEATGVLIRGLPMVRTEFNGRDSFSADAARGLNFNDISPELMSRVDAYKNQTADLIEGGIAGTVDLRTRLPFDHDGLVVTGNGKANYGDRSKKWTGEFSGLISDTFHTDIGKFGFLADFARSHVVTRTESVIMDRIDTYCSDYGAGDPAKVNSDGSIACTANPLNGNKGWAFMPDGVRFSQVDYDRTRRGIALAGQYQDNSERFLLTVQYTDSKYHNSWLERASHTMFENGAFGQPAFRPRNSTAIGPADGTGALTFGSDGMLTGGILTQGHGSWAGSWTSDQAAINTGSAVPGVPFVNNCAAPSVCTTLRDGLYFQNEARNFDHSEGTRDFSANAKWQITDNLKLNVDMQRITASTFNNDILVATSSMANMQYGVNQDGTPIVKLLPGSNVNYAPGGLTNLHNYWLPFIQGHVEDNDADEWAFRGDVQYDFNKGGWLDSLKVGVRYADRSQTVRYSTFNWTPITTSWQCNGPAFNIDNTTGGAYPPHDPANPNNPNNSCPTGNFNGWGKNIWETTSLGSGFFDGKVYNNGPLAYLNRATLQNYPALIQALGGATTNSPGQYQPICDRSNATIDNCFTPWEVTHTTEKTKAAYAMLDFGGDQAIFGGVRIKGNIGVRVIRTEVSSDGAIAFPDSTTFVPNFRPCNDPLPPNAVVNPGCYFNQGLLNFSNAGGAASTRTASYTNVLPSFNLRLGIGNKSYVRFAYSRALSRPDFGLLRNYVQINPPTIDPSASSPYLIKDSAGNITGYRFVFNAESGYAGLRPTTADQFDLTYERYMGKSSSFAIDLFYKKLHNAISYGQFQEDFTNNGTTATVLLRGPRNQSGGGTLKGFEVGYQTFFDFLPGLLSGLGVQANYTFVDQSGISNSNLIPVGALANGGTGAQGTGNSTGGPVIDSHVLAGISKHSFNLVGLYEKGPVALRLAYNWRSRFLTANLDCCIGLPVFQKAAGFMDGSVRFSINKYVELSVEGQNLLNTKTVYQQQVFGDSPTSPGAKPVFIDSNWGVADRRFAFGARLKF